MKCKSVFPMLLSLVVLTVLTGMTGPLLGQGGRVVSRFGQAQVEGRDVIVHVTVVVPPGANANQVALDAIRNQGARPFSSDEFSTTGLVWDQFSQDQDPTNDFVTQNYNPANEPFGPDVALGQLMSSQTTWTEVAGSKFAFDPTVGSTTNCPSLVKECQGPQTFDGQNDVGWLQIRGCCTLAVTWFSTSVDEADMALNTNFSWSTDSSGDFDVETVMLHENGHVVGLGHSTEQSAVMYATYHGIDPDLDPDDQLGIVTLYPDDGATGTISGTVSDAVTGGGIVGATVQVDGLGLEANTVGDGGYQITGVPEGTYSVTASATGFSGETLDNVLVSGGVDTSDMDFALTPLTGGSSVSVDSVTYQREGGRNGDKHLLVTVTLEDDIGTQVADASVTIELSRNGISVGTATGTTGLGGSVTFTLKNAAPGCYTTEVTNVSAGSLSWDMLTPDNDNPLGCSP